MALLGVRNPQMRENMRDFHERILRQVMSLTLATKERWESQVRQAKQNGVNLGEEVSYERMKEFHERGEYTIETRREMHIASELKAHDTVLQTLGARKWKLVHALPDQGFFVTSNCPVVLTWNDRAKVPLMMRHSPGFGMIDTEVIFPLTHTCALLGRFEGMEEGVEGAYGGIIAAFNTRMFSHASEYLFMREKSFPYFVPPQIGYHDDRFMERAKEYRERHPPKEEDAVERTAEKGPPIPKAMPMPERYLRWREAGFRTPGESREEL